MHAELAELTCSALTNAGQRQLSIEQTGYLLIRQEVTAQGITQDDRNQFITGFL
jgi:hypothetical protein